MTANAVRRFVAFLDKEALGVVVVAFFVLFSLVVIPHMLVQDTWLTLVSGREITEHGLPRVDSLTVWSRGSSWIDQQWLAQLLFFWTHELGGIKLVALAHVAVVVAGIASAVAAARSLGASALAVAVVTPAIFVAPWGYQIRAQTFAIPLFVWVVWLLAADSRSPSRRVFLVFPLLVLWANLHGTVVLAAALVALRGLTFTVGSLRERRPPREWLPRGVALIVGPAACLVASPYGLDLVAYYRTMLMNSNLRTFVVEWGPSTPSSETFMFFGLAFVTVGLIARFGHRLTPTERLILLATLASGLLAIRSIVWFALAVLVLVPSMLNEVLVVPPRLSGRLKAPAAASALAISGAAILVVAAAPTSWYVREWPAGAGDHVARLSSDPRTQVLSDDRYSDWLLWEYPELIGRIAYDVRFELLDRAALERLFRYENRIGAGSGRLAADFDVVALDHRVRPGLVASLTSPRGFRVVRRDSKITVLERVDPSDPAEDVQVRLVTP